MLLKVIATVCALMLGQAAHAASWDDTLAQARGQTVYWNAWGGDPQVNAYIAWVGDQVKERHGIDLVHVKLTDTAEAVARVVAEKAAGTDRGRRGRPDLDQRRELRLDEGAGSAVRPVRRRTCRTSATSTPRASRPRWSTSRCRPTASRRPGAWPSSCSSTIPPRSPSRRARFPPCSNGSRRNPGSLHLSGAARLHRQHLPEARAGRADRPARGAPAPRGSGRLRRGHGAAVGLARGGASPSLAQGRELSAVRPGAPSAAGRRRGRLLPGVQSGRSVGGDQRRADCPRRCAPSSSRTAPSATPTSSRSRSTPPTPPARWWSPTS